MFPLQLIPHTPIAKLNRLTGLERGELPLRISTGVSFNMESLMAGGFAKDGAVQDQIDASLEDRQAQ